MLTNYIAIMCIFLKQQYDTHALTEGDEVGTHGIVYGLCKPDLSVPARTERCNGCNFVNFCISEISCSSLPSSSCKDFRRYCERCFGNNKDTSHKLELY